MSPFKLITTSPYAISGACIFKWILLPFKQLVILEISYFHGLKDLRHPFDTRKWFSTPKTACSPTRSFKLELSRDLIGPSEKSHRPSFQIVGEILLCTLSPGKLVVAAKPRGGGEALGGRGQMGVGSVRRRRCVSFRSSPYLYVIIGDVTQIQGNRHIPLTDSIWIMQLRGKK